MITWQDYDELGGVIKSLTRRADEEYNALVKEDAAYETTIRHVMLRMVAIGGELARRRVYQKELVYPEPEYGRVKAFIQRFDAVRLLISDQDEKGEYVEPAHDALVTGWEKLLTWKKEEEETLILQRRLTPAAMEWDRVKDNYQTELFDKANPVINGLDRVLFPVENLLLKLIKLPADLMQKLRRSQHQQGILREKPAQFLWNSNPYLDVLDQEIHGENNWLNEAEREFIEASVLQKRRNISWRWRIAIAVMLGLSGLTIIAYIQQNLATKREKIAFARQLGSQSQIVQKEDAALLIRSTLLAVQSMQLGMEVGIRPFQAEQTLIQAKQLLPNPLPQFNLKDEDHLLNSQIALRTNEDNIQLINPINGKVIRSINCSNKCSWNINSKYLAKINNNGYVQIFDLVENKEISQLSYMNAKSISDSNSLMEFSSNGKYFGILNFKSKSLTIWNIVTKQKHSIILNQNFQGEDRYIYSSVIDNEGNFIYTEGNNQNRLELVKIDRQEKLSRIPLSTKQQILNIVSFSANGRYLIVGETNAAEQCVQVWDVDSGREILKINTDSPTDIAINANGNYLAISDRGGGLSIWDIPAGKEVKKIQYKNEGWIGGIQFSPNGKYLASYTWTIVRIHEIPSGKEISRIIHENTTSLSGFSTDGKYLLTSEDQDNGSPSQRKIWDLRDNINESENSNNITPEESSSGDLYDGIVSPNQKYKVIEENNILKIVRLADQENLITKKLKEDSWTTTIFSSDSQYIAIIEDNILEIIDIANKEVLWKKDTEQNYWRGFTISPNNQYIVGYTGSYGNSTKTTDGVLQIWDMTKGISIIKREYENAVFHANFSEDSKHIIYSFNFYIEEGISGIININTGEEVASVENPENLVKDVCRRLTRNLTLDEWKQYMGERKYQKICMNLPVHPKSSL